MTIRSAIPTVVLTSERAVELHLEETKSFCQTSNFGHPNTQYGGISSFPLPTRLYFLFPRSPNREPVTPTRQAPFQRRAPGPGSGVERCHSAADTRRQTGRVARDRGHRRGHWRERLRTGAWMRCHVPSVVCHRESESGWSGRGSWLGWVHDDEVRDGGIGT